MVQESSEEQRATILCIDDDKEYGVIYEKLLTDRGYQVVFRNSGRDVVNVLREQSIDLIVVDLIMPEVSGMDVIEVVRRDPEFQKLPIIVISGCNGEATIEESLRAGATDYLIKPLRVAELRAKVGIALEAAQVVHPELPEQLRKRYDVAEQISDTAFSNVYQGVDRQGQFGTVAIKVLKAGAFPSGHNAFQRFLREAYEHSTLEHHAIVRLLDFGQADDIYYLVTEFVDGQSLHEHVEEHGPMDVAQILNIVYDVALALQYMAQRELIHRDLKPANVLLAASGAVKLIDFGLARKQFDKTLSIGHAVQGTLSFMATEQLQGMPLDGRTDVYALGATIYYALAATPPYHGISVWDTISSHISSKPKPLEQIRPELPPMLTTLVNSMLDHEMSKRPDIDLVVSTLKSLRA